jgi:hypothetical protein
MHESRLYNIWRDMKHRCSPNARPRKRTYYFDRGIRVCADWQTFLGFREWALANGYTDELEIDRKDNSGNYEPANCRWTTRRENCRNMRKQVKYPREFIEQARQMAATGLSQAQISRATGMSPSHISNLLRGKRRVRGADMERLRTGP